MPADFNMMEATQSYGGLYFVLMGRLSRSTASARARFISTA